MPTLQQAKLVAEIEMSSTRKVVEDFHTVLQELEATGPDERWKARRRFSNLSLKLAESKLAYENAKRVCGVYSEFFETGEAMTDEDRANVKQAIELRRKIYRRVRELKGPSH